MLEGKGNLKKKGVLSKQKNPKSTTEKINTFDYIRQREKKKFQLKSHDKLPSRKTLQYM